MNENLNENTNPEVTSEESNTVAADGINETSEESAVNTVNLDDAAPVVAEGETAAEENVENIETELNADLSADTSETEQVITKKKKSILQVPVIIALCIVAAALIGYFVFVGFFLKEPEGVTWSSEQDGTTYYYEFKNDGTFQANIGSIEIDSSYQKMKAEDGNTITVGTSFGYLYVNAPATYSISGSRLLGNQTFNGSYGEGYDFTLKQDKKTIRMPDLPEDLNIDDRIVGTWVFNYMGYEVYKVTFNDDGHMELDFTQNGTVVKYSGVYTIDGSTVNFTFCETENVAAPIDYSVVDEDNMTFMGFNFVREGSAAAEATPDQQMISLQ